MPYSNPEAAPSLAQLLSLKGRTALVVGGAGLLGGIEKKEFEPERQTRQRQHAAQLAGSENPDFHG